MTMVPGKLAPAAPADTVPRNYNFAAEILERNLRAGRGDRVAYIDPHETLTYSQLAERVECFVRVLHKRGIRREERILLCLADTVDWPVAFLGAIKAGVVPVPVNTLMTTDDYRFMLADSRARMLVVSDALYPKFAGLVGSSPDLAHVIVSGPNGHGYHTFANVIADAAADIAEEGKLAAKLGRDPLPGPYTAPTTRDDVCFWLYTSGSTGKPKAAVHAHAHLRLTDDLYAGPILGLAEDDVCYSVAKLFFAYGLGNALTFPLSAGATTILLPDRPTPELVADVIRRHAVTVLYGVPTFYAGFLASAASPARAEVKLRLCVSAGEALPPDIGRRWRERYGVDILDGLGSTEMLHIFLSNRPGEVKYGTTGKPVPGYGIQLVGDDGEAVTPGEMGELMVRGPTAALMYWNNREQSRATFVGEWTRSGDKYIEDPEGYFVYCGRRDDMLKVGGIYVSPFEVEGALCTHADVLEAAVVGWADADGLVKPKAYVVLKSQARASASLAQALQEHCQSLLAGYKYPRVVEFRADLPKTATGKIQRFKLRAESAAR